jgi:hypothetical protein
LSVADLREDYTRLIYQINRQLQKKKPGLKTLSSSQSGFVLPEGLLLNDLIDSLKQFAALDGDLGKHGKTDIEY